MALLLDSMARLVVGRISDETQLAEHLLKNKV